MKKMNFKHYICLFSLENQQMSKNLLKLYRITPILKFFNSKRHTIKAGEKCTKCTKKYYTDDDLLLNDIAYVLSVSASVCFVTSVIASAYLKTHEDKGKIAELRTTCFVLAIVMCCACAFCVLFM